MRRKHRVLGFKAFHDADPDIIEFFDGLAEGQISEVLRAAVRSYISGYPSYPTPDRALDDINGKLDTIMSRLAQGLPVVMMAAPGVIPVEQHDSHGLTEEEKRQRERRISKNDW